MKNIYLLGLTLFLSTLLVAQKKEEKQETLVKFKGYIAYRAFMDTYESVDTREGHMYLYPKAENLDSTGSDLNTVNQIEAASLDTRIAAKINGPNAFGAKVTGLIEIDWNGTSNDYAHMIRLRHAMVKLSWDKANIIAGQYWHPMFTAACFPKTVNFGAAFPFNPLNRSPQIRFTYNFSEKFQVLAAVINYGYHNFKAADSEAQRNSGMPDFHGQIMYKTDALTVGVVGGIKSLKPRTSYFTEDTILLKTDKVLTSPDIKGFIKVKIADLTLSTAYTVGENMTPYVMIGGFGADTTTNSNDYDYSALKTMSWWFDGEYKINALKFGFFAGYSAILGSNDPYSELASSTRTGTLDNIVRISPRLTYTSGKVSLSAEYMYSAAVYGTEWDKNYKVTESADATINHRTMVAVKYAF